MPDWMIDLSVFTHVPRPPDDLVRSGAQVALAAITLGLAVLGAAAFRARDIKP
jgi:putative exporter of polyketide antibiotics